MVGSKYQAKIPPLGSYIYQERGKRLKHLNVQHLHDISAPLTLCAPLDFCCDDQLLWRPGVLPGKEVEEFLLYVQKHCDQQGAAGTQTPGDAVRDNEQVRRRRAEVNLCNGTLMLRLARQAVLHFMEHLEGGQRFLDS